MVLHRFFQNESTIRLARAAYVLKSTCHINNAQGINVVTRTRKSEDKGFQANKVGVHMGQGTDHDVAPIKLQPAEAPVVGLVVRVDTLASNPDFAQVWGRAARRNGKWHQEIPPWNRHHAPLHFRSYLYRREQLRRLTCTPCLLKAPARFSCAPSGNFHRRSCTQTNANIETSVSTHHTNKVCRILSVFCARL